MEGQMGAVISKVDDVLRKLDQVEGPPQRKPSAIGRGMRNIASARGEWAGGSLSKETLAGTNDGVVLDGKKGRPQKMAWFWMVRSDDHKNWHGFVQ